MQNLGIIGAGAWGTALAVAARRAGRAVVLWARDAELAAEIDARHENPRYLPGVPLDRSIRAPTVLTFGLSTTVHLGLPLPFDLGQLGAPGCWVINDILATLTNTTSPITGSVVNHFLVPNSLALRGAVFYSQYFFLSPGANLLGLFATNSQTNIVAGPQITWIVGHGGPGVTSGAVALQTGLTIALN